MRQFIWSSKYRGAFCGGCKVGKCKWEDECVNHRCGGVVPGSKSTKKNQLRGLE